MINGAPGETAVKETKSLFHLIRTQSQWQNCIRWFQTMAKIIHYCDKCMAAIFVSKCNLSIGDYQEKMERQHWSMVNWKKIQPFSLIPDDDIENLKRHGDPLPCEDYKSVWMNFFLNFIFCNLVKKSNVKNEVFNIWKKIRNLIILCFSGSSLSLFDVNLKN